MTFGTDAETLLLGQRKGLLTELLGPGGECEGYSLRFVGHSLGGSIAALTALRVHPPTSPAPSWSNKDCVPPSNDIYLY